MNLTAAILCMGLADSHLPPFLRSQHFMPRQSCGKSRSQAKLYCSSYCSCGWVISRQECGRAVSLLKTWLGIFEPLQLPWQVPRQWHLVADAAAALCSFSGFAFAGHTLQGTHPVWTKCSDDCCPAAPLQNDEHFVFRVVDLACQT